MSDPSLTTRSRARAFWATAASFLVVMSFMTVPTPLYGLYEARDGFGPFTVTLVFAAYGVGVVAGLVLAGHVSDHVGRRRVLLGVVVLEVVAAVGFALLADTASLLVLRALTGLGVGGLSATATAYLGELHERWRPDADPVLGRTVANVANLGGLAVAGLTETLAPCVVGGFLATGGVGVVFAASIATVAGLAAPERRAATLAALFLAAYVGITIPVVAVGALLLALDVVPVLVGFAALVAVAVPAGIAVLVRQTD